MYAWKYLDHSGKDVGTSDDFADQDEAESWMGQVWAELRDRRVEAVELIDREDGTSLYRMSLSEPDA